jgi:hypothetical protein
MRHDILKSFETSVPDFIRGAFLRLGAWESMGKGWGVHLRKLAHDDVIFIMTFVQEVRQVCHGGALRMPGADLGRVGSVCRMYVGCM